MLNKNVKFLGLLILIIGLAITMTACDMNGNDISNDKDKIIEIESISNIYVDYGTEFENIDELPEQVEVILDDYRNTDLQVDWRKGNYDGQEASTYIIVGELELPQGIENPDNIAPKIEIIVREQYSLNIEVEGEGTVVEPGEGEFVYNEGEKVDLKAEPADDWKFYTWSDNVHEPDNVETFVTMDNDKNVKVTFLHSDTPMPGEMLDYDSLSVSIISESTVYDSGSNIQRTELTMYPVEISGAKYNDEPLEGEYDLAFLIRGPDNRIYKDSHAFFFEEGGTKKDTKLEWYFVFHTPYMVEVDKDTEDVGIYFDYE